jgi:glucose-1-phosphate adenylyltransferase
VIDRCVLDKEIEIGAETQVGVGTDNTPNQLEPDNLDTGITLIGKRACVPAGAVIGRNCCIDMNTTLNDFARLQVPTGETISRRDTAHDEHTLHCTRHS